MPKTEQQHKDIIKRLDSIESLLQTLVIFGGEKAGLTKADVQKIVRIRSARVSEIWKSLKSK